MSCSQFIEHEEEDKNDTLVIIVNGDGTVTVDPLTLEKVLSQQSRAAVSVIRFENTDEPDSQTENVLIDNNEKTVDDKEKPCRKVNLVIEGYYPSASSNAADKNTTESVVSSTVGTPPLPTRNSSDFLDLLAEELEIPVSQLPTQSNMHAAAGDGGIGDSLVDAFSEMAPEQLKRVETALHSEKAKQILGDDVTCVLDTLKLNEEHDDWVHLDHCYTNIYGSKKQNQPERIPNVVVQDSEMATMLTIKVGGSGDSCISSPKDANIAGDVSNVSNENLELTMPENIEVINVQLPTNESSVESNNPKKKNVLPTKAKLVMGNKIVPIKNAPPHHLQDYSIKHDRSSTIVAATPQKVKRRSKDGSKNEIVLPERIVTEDEVDGVKVFKPTRNDKRINKTGSLSLSKDSSSMLKAHPQLVQSKLNLIKKVDSTIGHPSHQQSDKALPGDGVSTKVTVEAASRELSDAKNIPTKKENNARKTSTPATPETFGPALFSTPDIIRKINSEGGETASMYSRYDDDSISVDQQTADIEKRMSALENGEAILDELHLQVEMQKEMERITSQSNDDKLLSDLENSADEDQIDQNVNANVRATANTSSLSTKNYHYESNLDLDLDLNLDLEDSENENQNASTTSKTDSLDKSDNSDKNEGEYEDDPNKLWCLCNKPHNNRFMICCDACDNWFHGKCVGISKAIGEKMEQDGTEWLCPSCRKEKFAKERENKSKLPAAKSTASRLANRHGRSELTGGGASTSDELSDSKMAHSTPSIDGYFPPANATAGGSGEQAVRRKSSTGGGEKVSYTPCVECKEKRASLNSVYCSAECVSTYVTNSLKNLNNGQRIPLSEDRKINMIDRKTGHRVAGTRAPAVGDLNEWLLCNPNYEIDRPCALPTCRPIYASTFTKSVPKKPANPSIKPKEATGMASATTPTSAGAVKLPFSRSIQMVKAAKTNQEMAAKDGMTQSSMKQFVVKKGLPETVTSNSGVKDAAVATASATSAPVRKDDFKSKEKQRQIKIIPVQPLPSKPIEELKEKTTLAIKKSSGGIAAAAPTSSTTTTTITTTTTTTTPVSASVSAPPAAAPATVVSEKKKKAEPSKKVESKRPETKKKDAAGSANESCSSNVVTVPNADKIRANVRKGLNELFVNKMKDSPDIKLTEEEVSSLASSVEEEIFVLHNKDTGTKYKAKYRSLLFNIKQPQNTLFRRITLEKSLSLYELVRLTPEEMACTELAEWRQREAKHEIDMIKKTELENLQLSKVLVLKTHKGELEIESEPLPPCKADLIVPDLQPEDMLEEKDKSNAKKTLPYYFGKEKRGGGAASAKDDAADKKKSDKNAAPSSAADKHRKHHDHKDKHKSSKRSRRRRRRSSEREKHASGSGSGSSKRAKSSHRRDSKSPTKERRRSGSPLTSAAHTSADRSRSAEKSNRDRDRDEKDGRSRSRHRHDSGSASSPRRSRSKKPRSRSSSSKRKEDKTCEVADDAANTRSRDNAAEKEEHTTETEVAADATQVVVDAAAAVKADEDEITADLLNPFKSVDVDLSDMEPSSTVTIKTPPYTRSPSDAAAAAAVWKGTIVMPDIVRCNVTLKQVSGNCESLEDDMHSGEGSAVGRIDCVGRIEPNTVWDYISKVKKSGSKDILVLRFESLDVDDQNAYLSFYSYLNKKNRMAVVGNMGPSIKDFYVMPLASHSPIPQVLLPLDGPGFEDSRPHLLLAVVVRSRRRRYHDLLHNRHHHHHHHHQKHQVHVQHVGSSSSQKQLQQQDSFTPPHSPTSVFVQTARVPVTTSAAVENEEDEPYSPKDEDEDDDDDDNNNNNNNNDDDDDDEGEDNNNDGEDDDDNDNEVVQDENDEYDNGHDDADEPYSPSALDEQESKFTIDDSDNCSTTKVDEGANSSSFANDGDRPELYSPSEHFFNDIESSEVTLPDTLKNLLNRVKNRTSEPLPAEGDGGGGSGGILAGDPIVNAYKKSAANESEEEAEDATYEEPAYTPPQGVINLDDDDDVKDDDNGDGDGAAVDETGGSDDFDDDNNNEEDGAGENDESWSEKKVDDTNDSSNNENEDKTRHRVEFTTMTMAPTPTPAPAPAPFPVAESPEESKANRDPRRKTTAAAVAVAANIITQPPPPGMEDEFGSLAAVPKNDVINPMVMGATSMADAGYGTQIPFAYATPFAAMMSQPPPGQMYLAPAAMYPQPYATMAATATAPPPAQLYVPPPPPPSAMLRTDPSMIPLPIDAPDGRRSAEKRKSECEKDDDSSDDKKTSNSKSYKKHKSYYTSDSKSSENSRSSPNRHRSSSYESHRRGYQRDDVESGGSSSSRYGHKYGGGSNRSYRDRGGYWKSGSDYSSSSHKRYSRNGSSDRDRSSSSKRSRWEGSKHDHEDREHDSKKDKDRSGEHSKKSDSSRRSRS